MGDLEAALAYLAVNEGGFSNDTGDHGGATRFGITREDASCWLKRSVSVAEMQSFPYETAKAIYLAWYWLPLACNRISDEGIATAMFDIGVVRGIGIPPRYAQMTCNAHGSALKVDGHIGPLTLAAVNAMAPKAFLTTFEEYVELGFREIVQADFTQEKFLAGWTARARRLLSLA